MANISRTAKSGNDWSQAELRAYNISVEFQDATTFFGVIPLPRPDVADELLNNVDANRMAMEANYKLLRYAYLATCPVPSQESAVADFAVHLLTVLDYVPRARMARTHMDIPLTVCGQDCYANPDVCVVDANDILLLIQENKLHKESKDPEPQLIAGAIAAFQTNNNKRTCVMGQDPIICKVIPGITLVGTSPIFYKIPITAELVESVALGTFPAERTVVLAHLPDLARPALRLSEGISPLDNRVRILACYEAFKKFVN
jgi:hypothetical protein